MSAALGAVTGLLGGLADVVGVGAPAKGALDAASTAIGALSGLTGGSLAATAVTPMTDDQFVDLFAVIFAGSTVPGPGLGSVWKSNFAKLSNPDSVAYFAELGLVGAVPSKTDKQFLALLALAISASAIPAVKVAGMWKDNREVFRDAANTSFFRELGLIG